MPALSCVEAFLRQLAGPEQPLPEQALLEYLQECLADTSLSREDLEDTAASICPQLEQLPPAERWRRLSALRQQVRAASPAPPEPPAVRPATEEPPASTPSALPEKQGAATRSEEAPGLPEEQPGAAGGRGPEQEEEEEESVSTLRALCPGGSLLPAAFLRYLLQAWGGGSLEVTAQRLLDAREPAELQAERLRWQLLSREALNSETGGREAASEQQRRKDLLAKFMLEAERQPPQPGSRKGAQRRDALSTLCQDGPALPKVRYRDGVPATSRGEKYVVERLGEEWNGGSQGKVYTKGKRGKGFV